MNVVAQGVTILRGEHEVTSEWRKIFKASNVTDETLHRAQQLLDELSSESPLRFREGPDDLQDPRLELQKSAQICSSLHGLRSTRKPSEDP